MAGGRRKAKRNKRKCQRNGTTRQAISHFSPPKKRRKQYTLEQMQRAMELAAFGLMSVREAAGRNNVPSTTLHDRVSGRVVHNVNPRPVRYLNPVEENTLATFLKHCSEVGYGKTRKEVLAIAEGVARDKNILRGTKISQGWWRNFIERQGDLSLRRGDNTAHSRMDAVNAETMQHYFNLLKDVLDKNGLMNAPHQIYNVDESGVPLDPKALNVVAKKGSKKVRVRSTGRKGQVTVVACGNAASQVIPPMIIFDAKKLSCMDKR